MTANEEIQRPLDNLLAQVAKNQETLELGIDERRERSADPMTAAARVYRPTEIRTVTPSRDVGDAWEVFRCVPEVHYVVTQQARLVSRVAWDVIVNGVKSEPETAEEFMAQAFGGTKKVTQLARLASIHLQVAGSYWLVRIGGMWRIYGDPLPSKSRQFLLDNAEVFVRVWHPDPLDQEQADSPVLASLDVGRELILARAQSRAQARNRTAQLGIVLYPRDGVDDPDEFEANISEVIVAPLADERSTSVAVPNLVGFPSEFIDKWKPLDLSNKWDEKLTDRIERLVRQIAVGMDAPAEVLLGMSDTNHWCRPVGTLAYTRHGWAVPEIGEDILTIQGWKTVLDLYQGDAMDDPGIRLTVCNEHGGPHSYTIDATIGHSFYVERDGERLLTKDPRSGDLIFRGLDQRHEAAQHPVYEDTFVQLLAWYSSDGTLTGTEKRPGQIRIGKKDNWPHLEKVLTDLWGAAQERMPLGATKPMWRHEIREDGLHRAILNSHARNEILRVVPTKDKAVPLDFVRQLTADQLALFLDTWSYADGSVESGGYRISQRAEQRLAAPEYAAILLGYGVRRSIGMSRGFKRDLMHTLYVTPQHVKIQSIERITLVTEVWCPSTEAGTWLALDPFSGWTDYTGNTGWLVQEDNWLNHSEPYGITIGGGFSEAITELTDLDEGVLEIEPDPAALLKRRPSLEDTFRANELGAVGLEYVRTQLGADDEDAPTPEEIAARSSQNSPPANEEPAQPAIAAVQPGVPFDVDTLLRIDEVALEQLMDATDLAVQRALTKVGSKLRSMAQRDKTLELPRGSSAEVAIRVDTSNVPNLDETISSAVYELAGQVRRVLTRSYAKVRSAGVPLAEDPRDIDDAVALFAVAAASVAQSALDGRPTTALLWQAAVAVRSVAGGNGDPRAPQTAASINLSLSGLALGGRALGVIRDVFELVADQYQWDHVGGSGHDHPEHKDLDGKILDQNFILQNGVNWFPGDHDGCRCQLIPVLRKVS